MNAESAYQFVDTNILVYAHDQSAGEKHHRARTLLQELWQAETGCLSVQVLQEFYVTVTQKVKQPLTTAAAARIVEDLAFWRVYAPDARDVSGAIDLQQRYTMSFWDAMIMRSAVQLGCLILWSEDLNPGQSYGMVQVRNPFEE